MLPLLIVSGSPSSSVWLAFLIVFCLPRLDVPKKTDFATYPKSVPGARRPQSALRASQYALRAEALSASVDAFRDEHPLAPVDAVLLSDLFRCSFHGFFASYGTFFLDCG